MTKSPAKKKTQILKPTVHIGKSGVAEAQIKEIAKQLDARRIVKVKILKSALLEDTVEGIAQKISSETDSRIVEIIGHTFTLYKPRRKTPKIQPKRKS